MLVEVVNWPPQWKPRSRRRVLPAPATARAAWLRLLPAGDPGYGFAAPGVPELTIAGAAT